MLWIGEVVILIVGSGFLDTVAYIDMYLPSFIRLWITMESYVKWVPRREDFWAICLYLPENSFQFSF